ncbi:MAG: hypothetical protein R3C56_21660 [Pirellulaceae bacterium]
MSAGVYEIAAESSDCYGIVSFVAVPSGQGQQAAAAPVMEVYATSMRRPAVDEVLQSLWALKKASLPIDHSTGYPSQRNRWHRASSGYSRRCS